MLCFKLFQPVNQTSFDLHIQKTKEVLKDVRRLEEEAEEIHNQAVDREYELITQTMVDGPTPNHQQMQEIEALHKQSQTLVRKDLNQTILFTHMIMLLEIKDLTCITSTSRA